jgi:hypothetical protein
MTREKLPEKKIARKIVPRREDFSLLLSFSAFSQSSVAPCTHIDCLLSPVFASFVVINDAFMHLMKHCIALFMEFFSRLLLSQDTELLVLGCLKWDVSCVTPLDFIDLIISRLPIINKSCTDIDPEKIRKHAQAFISLAVRGESKEFHCFAPIVMGGMLHCLSHAQLSSIVLYAKKPR